mgnify:CR=1 FL=1
MTANYIKAAEVDLGHYVSYDGEVLEIVYSEEIDCVDFEPTGSLTFQNAYRFELSNGETFTMFERDTVRIIDPLKHRYLEADELTEYHHRHDCGAAVCHHCGDSGYVREETSMPYSSTHATAVSYDTCPKCDGLKLLPVGDET